MRSDPSLSGEFDDSAPAGGVLSDSAGIFASIAQSDGRAAAFLLMVSLIFLLPGFFSLPPIDRDEARFVQASKQMMEQGEYIDIPFGDGHRYHKPIGIYWLQIAAAGATGLGAQAPIWAYRLPSLMGAVLVVLLTSWIGTVLGDRRAGIIAGIIMASCILLGVEARLAKTDAMLNACILAAMAVLAELFLHRPQRLAWWRFLVFWTAFAAGVLIKGPVLPMVVGLTVIAASAAIRDVGWLKPLRPLTGLALAAAIVAPWFIAIGLISEGDYFAQSIGGDLLGKITQGQQGHGAPPGYYAALVWITLFPIGALLAPAIKPIWRRRREPEFLFLICWIVPTWLTFELIATKLPHYVLPLYPALALAVGLVVARSPEIVQSGWARALIAIGAVVAVVLPAAAAGGFVYLHHWLHPAAALGLIAAAGLAVMALRLLSRRQPVAAWLFAAAAMAPTYLVLYQGVFPHAPRLWPSTGIAEVIDTLPQCAGRNVVLSGYQEASAMFLIGSDISFVSPIAAAEAIGGSACAVAVVERRGNAAFRAALGEPMLQPIATIEGFNVGGGKAVVLDLYARGP